MQQEKKWYVVYTKPRWEKKVSDYLTRKKLENYCPLNKVVRQWSDRRKTLLEPLFTNYVFVRLNSNELVQAKQTIGVCDFVYWLGKVAVIKDEEIETIKHFLHHHSNILLERVTVNLHDNVRIIKGPFETLEGEITEVLHRVVKVQLPSLGFAMVAEVEHANVEVITRRNQLIAKA